MSYGSVDTSNVSQNESLLEDLVQQTCSNCKTIQTDLNRCQEEKSQSDKQLGKAREEMKMLSDLVKDMEHKWTEVAKDYEKQVYRLEKKKLF